LTRISILICALSLTLCGVASAQDDRPLGDVARDTRAAKSSAPKSTKVVTNDEVPASADQAGNQQVSPEKQAYCEKLRQLKVSSAEQYCAALRLDMGSGYEDLTARIFAISKNLCGATAGKGLPSKTSNDPQLVAQTREVNALREKFQEMMKAQMKSYVDTQVEANAIRKEEVEELSTAAPNWERPTDQMSAAEKQRFEEIDRKYKARIQEQDDLANRILARGARYAVDQDRMSLVCESH
jgi:hypothetical protein